MDCSPYSHFHLPPQEIYTPFTIMRFKPRFSGSTTVTFRTFHACSRKNYTFNFSGRIPRKAMKRKETVKEPY